MECAPSRREATDLMRSTSLFGRIITSVASLVTLGALAAGVPITLWTLVGWPLPAALPSLHEVAQALSRSDISDASLFKALALVGWIAWLQLAASMLVEAIAWARGRAAPRLRFAGAAQPAMCKLIASAALLLSSTHLPTSTSLTAGPQTRPATTIAVPVEMPTALLVRVDTQAHENITARSAASTNSYRVIRYDTLWGIADEHLGNPLRWREIFDLNRGKHQPDGRALRDPQLIIPGWMLTLPSDATGLAEEAVSRTPVVAPSQPTITHHRQPQPSPPTAPAAHTPRAPSDPTHAPTTAPTPATAPGVTARPSPTGHEHLEHHSGRGVDPALLIGGGLAAASLVALLDRLRRAQRRKRRAGRPFAAPHPELERVERRLRRAADVDEAELLDLALRAFATGATQTGIAPPVILAVRVSGGQVEILSDRPPKRLPKGFLATDDARGWITDPELSVDDLRDLGPGAAAPFPALVAVGDVDGGRLLIDVESAGTLTVDGDSERVGAFIRRLGVELATSIWADHVDVLAVGTTELDFVGARRVDHFTDIDAAIDELNAAALAIGDALDSARCGRTLEARISDHPDDGWIPTILVCAEPIEPEGLARLREITRDGGRGAGAVVASTVHARWHASLRETKLLLSPLGFHVTPALLDLRTATALDELLTDAAVGEPSDALDLPPRVEAGTEGRIWEPYTDPPFEIEVRVLGPVEIVGSRSPLERRRCIELATYLALHPKGASDERLKTVLWPDRAPTTATFNTTVSMTRSGLGRASDGTPHFPHCAATGGTYRLEPLVTTDLARFEARVAHAHQCVPAAAIVTLHSAMELVRGKPFDGARGYEWAFSEALIANVEATIADAAHQLAQLYLDAGDPQEATWAALRGLVAAPGDEILYRDRMLASDLAGNPAGVETVMDELCEVVEALEPYDELHPETLALYERISHRKRTRSA
jgi:DNA-binding SARP family transcriptional activator